MTKSRPGADSCTGQARRAPSCSYGEDTHTVMVTAALSALRSPCAQLCTCLCPLLRIRDTPEQEKCLGNKYMKGPGFPLSASAWGPGPLDPPGSSEQLSLFGPGGWTGWILPPASTSALCVIFLLLVHWFQTLMRPACMWPRRPARAPTDTPPSPVRGHFRAAECAAGSSLCSGACFPVARSGNVQPSSPGTRALMTKML